MATALLTSQAESHLPPSVLPLHMGSHAPVSQGGRALYDKAGPWGPGGAQYFQNYRNEALNRVTMPSYLYGCERTPYSARPDMVAADRIGNWERMLHHKPAHCSWLAPAQRAETDTFYKLCQRHRDQYRDHSGILHPLDFFSISKRPYHCTRDIFSIYRTYPDMFTKYRYPQSQPLTFGRTLPLPSLPARSLVGNFNQHSDTLWKGAHKAMYT